MSNKCCHDCGRTLETQKQPVLGAIHLLGVYSGSGTILDAFYLILINGVWTQILLRINQDSRA